MSEDDKTIDNVELNDEDVKKVKEHWRKAVEVSAKKRSAKRAEMDMLKAQEEAVKKMELEIRKREAQQKLEESSKKLKKVLESEQQSSSSEEEAPKQIKKPRKKVVKKKVVKEELSSSDSEESIDPKIFKKTIARKEVENRVDKLRDELIQKYMNGLFPKY